MKKHNILYILVALTFLISCAESSDNGADFSTKEGVAGAEGKGGSMARFAIYGNYLYTVDHNNMNVFDISTPETPTKQKDINIGWDIETIYPYQGRLYIGSRWGMEVYDISEPSSPVYLVSHQHIYSCDPVVVQDNFAYVTLRSDEDACGRSTNELQILDISDIFNIQLLKQYPMESPGGLGIDGNLLFICDKGLKVYDASDIYNLALLNTFDISAYDVIPLNEVLMVIGKEGLYQYSYKNEELTLLSTINVKSDNNEKNQ